MLRISQRLPKSYNYEIGRIITRWALIEWKFKYITYGLLDIDHSLGRLAVREPRVVDHITMIEEIMAFKKFAVMTNLKSLKTRLEELQVWRDHIAHSAWVVGGGDKYLIMQLAKGKWTPITEGTSVNRKVRPQGGVVTIEFLRSLVKRMDAEHVVINRFARQVYRVLKSSGISSPKIFRTLQVGGPSNGNPPSREIKAR